MIMLKNQQSKSRPQDIEHKTLPFEVKSFREDEQYFYFEGYLSTFWNEDRGGDVVVKAAFVDSLKEIWPSLLGFHKSDEPPLGVFDSVVEDDIGLYVKARMPLEDSYVRDRIIPQMKIGSIKSMSIGYSVWGSDGSEFKNGSRYLKKLKLWEGSIVTIPMNDQANFKELKNGMPFQDELKIAPRPTVWDEISALGRVRDWAGAEDGGLVDPEAQAKYRQAFLWYDQEDPDIFPSYKLLIADIIEGELTVVPRAVFAAAARLGGARGGVWFYFPEDRPRVIRTVEKYYEKMELPSPFGKSFHIDEFKAIDDRTLEKLLQSGVKMSQKNSKLMVSFLKAGFKSRDEAELESQRDVGTNEGWADLLESIKSITIN